MGIYILFEKENIDTGKMEGELLLSILSSLAESESHSISENEIWSIQKRFRNGTFKISYPPYGYDYIDGEMVVNPEQSEIVKWIFTEVLRSIFNLVMTVPGIRSFAAIVAWMREGCKAMVGLTVTQEVGFR